MDGHREIQWFPGHMTRTMRRIGKNMPLVDGVVQLLDARIPASSMNPQLQALYRNKPRLYVLNKADLADEAATADWIAALRREEANCVALDSRQKGAAAKAKRAVETGLTELFEKRKFKVMPGAKIRLMVTGIPNAGKSTFINTWAGRASAKTADKPGVTRGEQWITAGQYELLDMPGVLWNKFEPLTAVNLALIGSIPDYILDVEEIAAGFLQEAAAAQPGALTARFKLSDEELALPGGYDLLAAVGRRRGMLVSGGEVDTERAAIAVLDEFRAGKLGRITLEKPNSLTT